MNKSIPGPYSENNNFQLSKPKAEASADPLAFMRKKSKSSSNPKIGRVILRKRSKPQKMRKTKICTNCKKSKKSKKSKKKRSKKCKGKKCRKCTGCYPIPYPGAMPGKIKNGIEFDWWSLLNKLQSVDLNWYFTDFSIHWLLPESRSNNSVNRIHSVNRIDSVNGEYCKYRLHRLHRIHSKYGQHSFFIRRAISRKGRISDSLSFFNTSLWHFIHVFKFIYLHHLKTENIHSYFQVNTQQCILFELSESHKNDWNKPKKCLFTSSTSAV